MSFHTVYVQDISNPIETFQVYVTKENYSSITVDDLSSKVFGASCKVKVIYIRPDGRLTRIQNVQDFKVALKLACKAKVYEPFIDRDTLGINVFILKHQSSSGPFMIIRRRYVCETCLTPMSLKKSGSRFSIFPL